MTGRGLFITFEGGEGAGKTTQIKKLGHSIGDCVLTREPGGTVEAEAMRDLFVAHNGQNWPVQAQLLLMFAARTLHTENFIKPAITKGKTVLCDRYVDSSRVYQGYAGGIPLEKIEEIKLTAIGDFEPDITFILDLPSETGLMRARKRGALVALLDTFESKDILFHNQIRQGFLEIARQNPKRCVVIDALQDQDAIAAQILERVKNHVR